MPTDTEALPRKQTDGEEPRSVSIVVQPNADSLMAVIGRAASDPATDVEKLERLMGLYERMTSQTARSAYAAAFAEMQEELPTIRENGKGDKGMKYALWEDVSEAIKPVLARHGFGISFRTGRTPDRVTVTAILMHRAGHAEETTLELPVDTSGSKNAVQAVGSSTSYGKRYTASALLNLTSRDGMERDDDGRGSGTPASVTPAQADEIRALIATVGADLGRFLKHIKATSVEDIPAKSFPSVIAALEAKRQPR